MTDALHIDKTVLAPAMELLPSRMNSDRARVALLAICGQESDFHHRWQVIDRARPHVRGPARGLWQFERGGGVLDVLTHRASRDLAREVCAERGVAPNSEAVHLALETDDVLAACFARLLLWTDPQPLPPLGAVSSAFALYLRAWRPGAYDRGSQNQRAELRRKWDVYYAQALEAVTGRADFSGVTTQFDSSARRA
ncbi:hypothetical protein LY625_03810 [Lysobacter sp. GX 14042]|uniref:hypothetical protein n=1 Tax=Lysobacter sp. GX 14042 TaxID=2907155 RepID=UPI001F229489|nr:hypothetical protein [Lysobacter sp. GX 14042]MCE7031750.1 hypothetical protein [Lysobacter sp. GX 14042]